MMNNIENDNMIRINPRTGRNIKVGGKVWKSLTKDEQNKADIGGIRFTEIPPPILDEEGIGGVRRFTEIGKRVAERIEAEIPPPIPDDSDDEEGFGGVRRFTEIGKRVAE